MAAIAGVRALFETRLKEGIPIPPGEFHPIDLELRVNNDNYIKRLLLHHQDDVKAAANMLWDVCVWRQTVGANEINESTINMDYIREGGMFPHGRDIESSLLMIFKCKLHTKGGKDFEQLKKCIIYWFDRIEREENGMPISLFFDLDDCGLSNMDMELIKYLILLMKNYYPAFLQYILIFQMPWVLTATFKLVKNLLPAQAVNKMKFLNKDTLKELVAPEQALTSWGGKDDYKFEFVPEIKNDGKKVTFADQGSHSPGEMLKIVPGDVIVFKDENDELTGSVLITNMDESPISFKVRTTAPDKFRVRPSIGTLDVGASQTVVIIVHSGFQSKNVTKDRFLFMSVQIPRSNLSSQEISEIWSKSSSSKVDEYRLKCQFPIKESEARNGNVLLHQETDQVQVKLKTLQKNYDKINKDLKVLKIYQIILLFLTLVVACFGYLIYNLLELNGTCSNI